MTTIKAGNDDNNKEEPKKAEGADATQPGETNARQPADEQDNKPVVVPAPEEVKAEDNAVAGARSVVTGDAPAETAPAPKKKGWLGILFNAACCGGAGFVVGSAVKAGLVATLGTAIGAQVATVAIGAAAIGAASTATQRALDIRAYNKEHADAKLSYVKDFFKASATGHDAAHYRKRLMISSAFALGGGFIGLAFGDKIAGLLGLGGDPAPATTVTPDTPIVPSVETTPDITVPVPDGSTDIANTPPAIIGDGTVTPDATPDVAPEATPEVTPEKTPDVAVTPDTTPDVAPETTPEATVPVPSLDSRVQDVMKEVYQNLPAKPGSKLAEALARTTSENPAVKAQALKDLGYFFANGFARVPENDALANKLFEMSLAVSDGKNAQAAHDLGYQLFYGKGAAADMVRGRELLESAAAKGNKLSIEMLRQLPAPRP